MAAVTFVRQVMNRAIANHSPNEERRKKNLNIPQAKEDQKRIQNMKMRQLLWTAVCCLVLLSLCVGGKRVVFMPLPFTSHTNYHTNVARTLTRQGHEVWLTMPDYIVNRRVLDTTNLTVIEYQTLINFEEIMTAAFPGNYFKGFHVCSNGQYEALFHAVPVVCTPLFLTSSTTLSACA
ncbi:hypothetical protein C0Q70_11989 [Pomacea canaliculata]|uniref:Uncharacterized protein n=1 Tax=Pomacea canaliculata TaxID=400727 RepID=A0A2T7P094_POMCA|nr:hypothetical protein C0Q70_11989 [Pomacea canaliculata]